MVPPLLEAIIPEGKISFSISLNQYMRQEENLLLNIHLFLQGDSVVVIFLLDSE